MALTSEYIQQRLTENFPEVLNGFLEPYGMLTFSAPREKNIEVLKFLFDDPELRFQFLTDLCAVHYPERTGEELAVVYHLHNLFDNVRIRFNVFMPIETPDVFTATTVFEVGKLDGKRNIRFLRG